MGWTIVFEDENGQAIQTLPKEFNYSELENLDFSGFTLLKYIDFYGDTTFNTLQLADLRNDFEKLNSMVAIQNDIIGQIIALIIESQSKVHTYIKFYGD